jgi:hypothetical protein
MPAEIHLCMLTHIQKYMHTCIDMQVAAYTCAYFNLVNFHYFLNSMFLLWVFKSNVALSGTEFPSLPFSLDVTGLEKY